MTALRPVPHPQLETLAKELDDATARAEALAGRVTDDVLHRRRNPLGWSPAECIAHLNLTSQGMLPRLDQGISQCSTSERDLTRRYRRDLVGWLLSRTLEPPARQKFKTGPPFVPTSTGTKEALL